MYFGWRHGNRVLIKRDSTCNNANEVYRFLLHNEAERKRILKAGDAVRPTTFSDFYIDDSLFSFPLPILQRLDDNAFYELIERQLGGIEAT